MIIHFSKGGHINLIFYNAHFNMHVIPSLKCEEINERDTPNTITYLTYLVMSKQRLEAWHPTPPIPTEHLTHSSHNIIIEPTY